MLTLVDSIEIKASRDKIEDWFKHLDQHYTDWHPDHVKGEFLTGGFDEGDICYFEEYLHGRLHRLKFQMNSVRKNGASFFEYGLMGTLGKLLGAKGTFEIKPGEDASTFTATFSFRGGRLISKVMKGEIEALKLHMQEEGINLKKIMESTENAPLDPTDE